MRRTFAAISIILSFVFALAAFGVPLGTSFTYQGQLRRSGAAYNGLCNFQFSLWDAASGGAQQGSTLPINGVNVVNGLFTVALDFGDLFKGDARWLATNVQCSGDGGFTQLDPRQPITAAPYALSLQPGASIIDSDASASLPALFVQTLSTSATGLAANGHIGVYGSSLSHLGVGVRGVATEFGSYGVDGSSSGQNGAGLHGSADGQNGTGVYGSGNTLATAGVYGLTANSSGSGVYGTATGANAAGVFGVNSAGAGVWGRSTGGGAAIYGQNTGGGLAGRFTGPVVIEGNLIVQGAVSKGGGSFRIDHPLDPANKFLSHSFVESPDMMNIYNGNVTTDASGSATVTLPDYFATLNRDYRYQLTVLGQFAQAIVARKVGGNSFEIRTDKPGVEVSWQVTGIRQDAYAKGNPIVVEAFKPAEEKGKYLYPAGFGAGEEQRIGHRDAAVVPATELKPSK